MKFAKLAAIIAVAMAAPSSATMVFDGSTLARTASGFFGVNGGALGRYTFASATTISSFSTLYALGAPANLTFRIYDSTVGTLLFTSASKAFSADASSNIADATFKKSDLLSFTFQPGTIYAIGAITDSTDARVIGSSQTKTEGGISALLGNQNVNNGVFSTGQACCAVAAQFFVGETSTIPEPMSWSLMLVGFAMVGSVARRRSAVTA